MVTETAAPVDTPADRADARAADLRPPGTRQGAGPVRVCHVLHRWSRCGMELQLANQLRFFDSSRIKAWVASSLPPESRVPQVGEDLEVRAFTGGGGRGRFAAWLADKLIETSADLVHARGLWMLPEALWAAGAAGELPVVFSFHGFDDANRSVSWWRRRRWRRGLGQCAAVVTVSEATRDDLTGALKPPCDRIEVIHNGVDAGWFRPAIDSAAARAELGFDDARPILLSVGSLMPVKGYDVLIDALKATHLPPDALHVVFVGSDRLNGALHRQAAGKLGGWDVRFVGSVDDVRPYYAAAAALVAPSRREGLSNVILEAMASGLAVVATGVGGTGELVVRNETGWLVPPDDPPALAGAIIELLSNADEARRRGLAGRRLVQRRFPLTRAAQRYQELYVRVHRQYGKSGTEFGP